MTTNENIKPASVLNESAVFAFNARTELSPDCSKTVRFMQAKFHFWVEFIALFGGIHDVFEVAHRVSVAYSHIPSGCTPQRTFSTRDINVACGSADMGTSMALFRRL